MHRKPFWQQKGFEYIVAAAVLPALELAKAFSYLLTQDVFKRESKCGIRHNAHVCLVAHA